MVKRTCFLARSAVRGAVEDGGLGARSIQLTRPVTTMPASSVAMEMPSKNSGLGDLCWWEEVSKASRSSSENPVWVSL